MRTTMSLLVGTVLACAWVSPAMAEDGFFRDAKGDVEANICFDESKPTGCAWEPAGKNSADITTLHVDYHRHRLFIEIRVSDLDQAVAQESAVGSTFDVSGVVRTSDGRYFAYQTTNGVAGGLRLAGTFIDTRTKKPCAHASFLANPTYSSVVASVPATCLGTPGRVQASAAMSYATPASSGSATTTTYSDVVGGSSEDLGTGIHAQHYSNWVDRG